MGRRSVKEIQDWEEFLCRERPFVRRRFLAETTRGEHTQLPSPLQIATR